MARPPDKPGEYRVREQPDGWYRVSGMKRDGTRVKHQKFASKGEADTYVALNFETQPLDEWGLPATPSAMRMDPAVTTRVNAAIGVQSPVVKVETDAEKERKKKTAMGLMSLAGTGWAAGTVIMGRKLCENVDKEPVNPDPKQVRDLAESMKETLEGWFGEKEIKPWQLTILLTIGIPVTMMMQSKVKEKKAEPSLKSVP